MVYVHIIFSKTIPTSIPLEWAVLVGWANFKDLKLHGLPMYVGESQLWHLHTIICKFHISSDDSTILFFPFYVIHASQMFHFFKATTLHLRDSISRPIAPIFSMAGGDDTTRPRHQGTSNVFNL
jgi:hypothetical protein